MFDYQLTKAGKRRLQHPRRFPLPSLQVAHSEKLVKHPKVSSSVIDLADICILFTGWIGIGSHFRGKSYPVPTIGDPVVVVVNDHVLEPTRRAPSVAIGRHRSPSVAIGRHRSSPITSDLLGVVSFMSD